MKARPNPTVVRRKALNALPNLLPFAVTFTHVFLAPYTKVEESFTLHAVHDVLAYGLSPSYLSRWDHITFPGAVPRSFLPPILLGLITYPFSAMGVGLGLIKTKIGVQILVRLTLASLFSHTFNHLAKTLRTRYGPGVRIWFTILSLSSFHIPFYAGRTLPNFLALPGVLLSISLILRAQSNTIPATITKKRTRNAILLLTALATVVRLEIALFLLPVALSLIIFGRAGLRQVVGWGMLGGFGSLAISAPTDYLLWKPTIPHPSLPTFTSPLQILWPELSALHYNAIQGNAAEWGVMAWHYYLTNSIPKLLVGSLPLLVVGLNIWTLRSVGVRLGGKEGDKVAEGAGEVLRLFGLGVVGLIGAMSCIGHKEWRFIIYTIPIFQLIASFAAAGLWSFPYPRLRPLVRLGLVGLVGINLLSTGFMTFLSVNNYPGGEVWQVLEGLEGAQDGPITIHFPSYPLQTGATLFTFLHQPLDLNVTSPSASSSSSSSTAESGPGTSTDAKSISSWPYSAFPPSRKPAWTYSKSESEAYATPFALWETDMDYVVTEDWESFQHRPASDGIGAWKVVAEVQGLEGVGRGGKFGIQVNWGRKLVVLGRGISKGKRD